MLRLLSLCTCLGLAMAGAPAAATAAKRCTAPSQARVVARSAQAVLYTRLVSDPAAPRTLEAARQRYWSCLTARPRLRRIYDAEPYASGLTAKVRQIRLAGTYAAFVVTSVDHYGGFRRTVRATDLRGVHRPREATVRDGNFGTAAGPDRPLTILDITIDAGGAMHWLQRDVGFREPPTDRLLTLTRRGAVQLDAASPGEIGDVRRGPRHALEWRHAGAPRAITLQPFWR